MFCLYSAYCSCNQNNNNNNNNVSWFLYYFEKSDVNFCSLFYGKLLIEWESSSQINHVAWRVRGYKFVRDAKSNGTIPIDENFSEKKSRVWEHPAKCF